MLSRNAAKFQHNRIKSIIKKIFSEGEGKNE